MNVGLLIQQLAKLLGCEIEKDRNLSGEAEYMTYNYATDTPALFAGDLDEADETGVMVHWFGPKTKTGPMKRAIRLGLRGLGFVVTSIEDGPVEKSMLGHVVVSAVIIGTDETEE